jgi:hypothetical protein
MAGLPAIARALLRPVDLVSHLVTYYAFRFTAPLLYLSHRIRGYDSRNLCLPSTSLILHA